jgi:hypothetical protein
MWADARTKDSSEPLLMNRSALENPEAVKNKLMPSLERDLPYFLAFLSLSDFEVEALVVEALVLGAAAFFESLRSSNSMAISAVVGNHNPGIFYSGRNVLEPGAKRQPAAERHGWHNRRPGTMRG